jgi:hypothetical protein
MTAVVDIHADRIRNILAVPVQAVFQIDKDHWCYVFSPNGPEKRKVELGRSNDKFVHITNGLAAGTRVVLNPMSLLEATASSDNEIGPDNDAPDVPNIPIEKSVERIADNKAGPGAAASKTGGAKGKGKRPPRTGGGAKSKSGDAPTPTPAAAGS